MDVLKKLKQKDEKKKGDQRNPRGDRDDPGIASRMDSTGRVHGLHMRGKGHVERTNQPIALEPLRECANGFDDMPLLEAMPASDVRERLEEVIRLMAEANKTHAAAIRELADNIARLEREDKKAIDAAIAEVQATLSQDKVQAKAEQQKAFLDLQEQLKADKQARVAAKAAAHAQLQAEQQEAARILKEQRAAKAAALQASQQAAKLAAKPPPSTTPIQVSAPAIDVPTTFDGPCLETLVAAPITMGKPGQAIPSAAASKPAAAQAETDLTLTTTTSTSTSPLDIVTSPSPSVIGFAPMLSEFPTLSGKLAADPKLTPLLATLAKIPSISNAPKIDSTSVVSTRPLRGPPKQPSDLSSITQPPPEPSSPQTNEQKLQRLSELISHDLFLRRHHNLVPSPTGPFLGNCLPTYKITPDLVSHGQLSEELIKQFWRATPKQSLRQLQAASERSTRLELATAIASKQTPTSK